jgi:hypothetical protein
VVSDPCVLAQPHGRHPHTVYALLPCHQPGVWNVGWGKGEKPWAVWGGERPWSHQVQEEWRSGLQRGLTRLSTLPSTQAWCHVSHGCLGLWRISCQQHHNQRRVTGSVPRLRRGSRPSWIARHFLAGASWVSSCLACGPLFTLGARSSLTVVGQHTIQMIGKRLQQVFDDLGTRIGIRPDVPHMRRGSVRSLSSHGP